MFTALLLSSIAAGTIATFIMIVFLYLPILWGGDYYDVMGAIGSAISRELTSRSRFMGGIIYFLTGILFSILYGYLALSLIQNAEALNLPQVMMSPDMPVEINLIYPLLGLAVGLGHGIIVSLLATVIVIEHHPLEQFHTRYILIISQLISHIAFGITVMFFHSQFLQLLLNRS